MMKRLTSLLLSVLLIASLTLPASAMLKVRGYSGFTDVPEAGSPLWNAVSACYEAGLINGKTETTFDPQGQLTVGQLVVMAARLYSLEHDGRGEIPALPTAAMLNTSCLRFYDESGKLLKSFKPGDSVGFNALGGNLFITLSETPDDPALPEKCTLEVGLEGYGTVRRYQGTRESYDPLPGVMNQGFSGTGYRFLDEDNISRFFLTFDKDLVELLKDAWWFPAAFYLASEGRLNLSGDLFYRVILEHGDSKDPDPFAGFSAPASRALFAWLVDAVTGNLEPLHETVSVPDVDPEKTQDAEAILRLYRAGVLAGVDQAGTFSGGSPLTRAQAAIMLYRAAEPSARV